MTKASLFALGGTFLVVSCTHTAPVLRAPWGAAPIPIAAGDLNWTALDPSGAPGVQIAQLWGDPGRGPFGAFLKLPAGFESPLHTHSFPMKVVIVSGTYIQQPDGSPEFRLGSGSYLMQPGSDYRHVTRCSADADCVFYFESEGAFDLHVVQ
jgi:beta-alanine degradation protein BauB